METLTIEDLKNLIFVIDTHIYDYGPSDDVEESLFQSKRIIEQMIKDLEFEQNKEL